MKTSALNLLALLITLGVASLGRAQVQIDHTDSFTGNNDTFSIDFTRIGDAGNAADITGYGAVAYNYNIGTYTISQSQIAAAGIPGLSVRGLYNGLKPATPISWYQAAAFVNFLNNSTGHQEAYNLSYNGGTYTMALWASEQAGYDPSNPFRNGLAKYFLPSENEWYKAAYYNTATSSYNLYPTGNNEPVFVISGTNAGTAVFDVIDPADVNQAGGGSAYGTMGQGGNLYQWQESNASGSNTDPSGVRVVRGGAYYNYDAHNLQSSYRYSLNPSDPYEGIVGFRVASIADAVPEPSIYALFGIGAIGMLMVIRRKNTA